MESSLKINHLSFGSIKEKEEQIHFNIVKFYKKYVNRKKIHRRFTVISNLMESFIRISCPSKISFRKESTKTI
jgi:hypothetical protein